MEEERKGPGSANGQLGGAGGALAGRDGGGLNADVRLSGAPGVILPQKYATDLISCLTFLSFFFLTAEFTY